MPTDPQDELQIKPVGGQSTALPSQNTTSSGQTTANSNGQTDPANSASAGSLVTNVVANDNSNQTPAKPVNQRAFNLEADIENSATNIAKPDKFAIPKLVREKYPELIELVKSTESMDDEEREYWFQIMPVMTADQIEKFKQILLTEKQQLTDLDREYEDELNRLNEKHLIEWKEFENKEKSKAIKDAEAVDKQAQQKLEEELLAKLSDV